MVFSSLCSAYHALHKDFVEESLLMFIVSSGCAPTPTLVGSGDRLCPLPFTLTVILLHLGQYLAIPIPLWVI